MLESDEELLVELLLIDWDESLELDPVDTLELDDRLLSESLLVLRDEILESDDELLVDPDEVDCDEPDDRLELDEVDCDDKLEPDDNSLESEDMLEEELDGSPLLELEEELDRSPLLEELDRPSLLSGVPSMVNVLGLF